MATNKAASAKKSKTASTKKQTTTRVTTVKSTSTKPKNTVKGSTRELVDSKSKSPLTAALVAEFIGTFILAVIVISTSGNAIPVGFALIAIVLMIGALSGAHVNPLVTAGAWVTRRIGGKRALGYIAAQALGAMLALVVMSSYAGLMGEPNEQAAMMGIQQGLFKVNPISGESKAVWHVFFAEMVGASIFGFAVASAIQERRNRAAQALAVGFGLFTALTVAGGAAALAQAHIILNPAVALSVQAVQWPLKDIFPVLVYVISPILGGAIGFFLYDLMRGQQESKSDEE
ncbi:hypothetical protein GX865_01655 [Candidatus Saccharibacteria bacterium]|jgi:glycerol uptake facilitator-like aquaporin|nr:hypothetical protein [Candidatus Saccharibacteria bacterium]